MSTTTKKLVSECVQQALELPEIADVQINRYAYARVPRPQNPIVSTKTTHWVDMCQREGYVSKRQMIDDLLSNGERYIAALQNTHWQGNYNPDLIAQMEEEMEVYPQARHDYDFDDLYRDSEAVLRMLKAHELAMTRQNEVTNATKAPSEQNASPTAPASQEVPQSAPSGAN